MSILPTFDWITFGRQRAAHLHMLCTTASIQCMVTVSKNKSGLHILCDDARKQ